MGHGMIPGDGGFDVAVGLARGDVHVVLELQHSNSLHLPGKVLKGWGTMPTPCSSQRML